MDENTTDGDTAAGFDTDAYGDLPGQLPEDGERLLGGVTGPDLADLPLDGGTDDHPGTAADGPPPQSSPAYTPTPTFPSPGYATSPYSLPTYSPGTFVSGHSAGSATPAPGATPHPSPGATPHRGAHPTRDTHYARYTPTPDTPEPNLTDTPHVVPRPTRVKPNQGRRPGAAIAGVWLIVGLVLVIGTVMTSNTFSQPYHPPVAPAPPAPAQYGTAWSAPIAAVPSDPDSPPPVTFGDTIVLVGGIGEANTLTAVDLAAGVVLWSAHSLQTPNALLGDSTVIAEYLSLDTPSRDTVAVYDPADGTRLGTLYADENSALTLYWAGRGLVLTSDSHDLCMRNITALTTCLWTSPDRWYALGSDPVFDDGRLVNTDKGVVVATTGNPASFGADAGSADPTGAVFYLGSTDTVLFRVVQALPTDSPRYTYQVWDPITNTGVATPVGGDAMVMDLASRTLITLTDTTDPNGMVGSTRLAAYDLDTSTALWQTSVTGSFSRTGHAFIGGRFLWTDPYGTGATAFDPRTGAIAWQNTDRIEWQIGNGRLYAGNGLGWTQYDPVTGQVITRLDPPSKANYISLLGTPNHVIAYSADGQLWVLEQ